MEKKISAKLHNRFDIEIRDSKTGELKQKAYAENIILNQAWARILRTELNYLKKDWFARINFGTGTGTIDATRTAMFSQLGYKDAANALWGANYAEGWYSLRQQISILETEYNGSVLTEVGIGNETLCTHALIKDMNGNQVAITKIATDIVTIYATVFLKISAFDKDAQIDFTRTPAQDNPLLSILLGRYTNYQLSTGFIAYNGKSNSIAYAKWESGSNVVFDVANKRYSFYTRIPAASANIGGIDTVMLYSYTFNDYNPITLVSALMHFDSTAHTQAKVIEQIGTGDGVTTSFATAFPFVKAGAIIKVDGTVVTPTVLNGLPNVANIINYLKRLGETGYGECSADCIYPNLTSLRAMILENPFYATYGIDSIKLTRGTLFSSDDMISWTQIYTTTEGDAVYAVASEHRQKRYFKIVCSTASNWYLTEVNCNALANLKNVVFASAPSNGAIITAEYDTAVAAKDANHVLDITVTVQLGEYVP